MSYIAIVLADGFEEIEALLPCDFLRRAKLKTLLVSTTKQQVVHGSHDIKVVCDILLEEIDASEVSMVIVPGGMPGTSTLALNNDVINLLNSVYAAGGYVAAICAAPALVLPRTNFFAGKTFTCTPSQRDQLADQSHYREQPVVVSERMVTSRGPGTAAEFTHALLSILVGSSDADELMQRSLYVLQQ